MQYVRFMHNFWCYAGTAALSRLRNMGFPLDTLLYLYKSLFESIISYCITVWGRTHITHLNTLEVAQRDAIRTIFDLPRRSNVATVFKDNKILTLSQLYIFRVGCLMYKVVRGDTHLIPNFRDQLSYPLRGAHPTDLELSTETCNYVINSPSYNTSLYGIKFHLTHAHRWPSRNFVVKC